MNSLEVDIYGLVRQVREQKVEIDLLREGATPFLRTTATTPVSIPAQASNQLKNGDLAHSIYTWNNLHSGTNWVTSCAFFYTHTVPTATQELFLTFLSGVANNSIKSVSDTYYDATYTDWDLSKGYARLNGTTTLDTPLPQNLANPGKTEYLVFLAARANQYISLADDCRLFGGIWDNTAGQRNWLTAATAFTVTGSVVGTPAGTTSRKYKIYARTDKGYDYLSNELTLASAPNNGSFVANSVYVSLSWDSLPGVISYDVYRLTGATYEFLYSITNGSTSYNDQNNVEATVAGYPTATDTYNRAYNSTRVGELANLAVDGVSSAWSTIELPIRIPSDYDQSVTTSNQWVRLGLTQAADLSIDNCTTHSNTTVDLPDTILTADHVGLTVELSDGTNTATRTINAQAGNSLTLSSSISWSNSITTVRVVGGGFHGVYVDLVHVSYATGSVYSPHAEDYNHTLQPVSAPNGSTQGGVGVAGDGSSDGGVRCLWEDETVLTLIGGERVWKKAKECRIGEALPSGNLQPNYITDIGFGVADTVTIRTRNGWEKHCTLTHRVITSVMDINGTMVKRLRVYDIVLTDMDGKIEPSTIIAIEPHLEKQKVVTFTLSPTRTFMSGHCEGHTGGIIDHNMKEFFDISTA